METIFLAHGFWPEERAFASRVESVLASHGLKPVTGDVLEGQPLTSEVQELIRASDGLVALLQARPPADGGMSLWVRDELQFANAIDIPAIAVQESTVPVAGMNADDARVDYVPGHETDALLDLSARLGLWKRKHGRRVKVRILPEDAERSLQGVSGPPQCEYQLRGPRNGQILRPWSSAPILLEPGGAFAFLERVPNEALIELRFSGAQETWASRATPQWLHVELARSAS